MTLDEAKEAVARIVADLTDRRGLRQEWEEIDDETQTEIRERWAVIIYNVDTLSRR